MENSSDSADKPGWYSAINTALAPARHEEMSFNDFVLNYPGFRNLLDILDELQLTDDISFKKPYTIVDVRFHLVWDVYDLFPVIKYPKGSPQPYQKNYDLRKEAFHHLEDYWKYHQKQDRNAVLLGHLKESDQFANR